MSVLVEFYRGQGRDAEGRRLSDMWQWSDAEWEACHDFIQWLFPLPEPSQFNSQAPRLTDEDIRAFHRDKHLRQNLHQSFERFLTFLGLSVRQTGEVVSGEHFETRVPEIWSGFNHNWLRITRMLRSLRLLGLEDEAGSAYRCLEALRSSGRFPIGADTFQYWTEAVSGVPFHR